MGRLFAVAVSTAALVLSVIAGPAPATAGPITGTDLLAPAEVASVYPDLADADRLRGRSGITAPRAVVRAGRLHCDRYRSIRGTSRRYVLFFDAGRERTVVLEQHVVRLRDVREAKAVLRHYRHYVRTCQGAHGTTDGEGGRARMVVRGWSTPRIGDGAVGLLVAFSQHGFTTWRRTLIARTGRTVTLQEAVPHSGKGSADRLVAVSRLAVDRLSDA